MDKSISRCGLRCLVGFLVSISAQRAAPAAGGPATTKPGIEGTAAASLLEATRLIDFRKFPSLDREEISQATATKILYFLADPDLSRALQFYRSKLLEAGWKLAAEELDPANDAATLVGTKQGFFVSVTIAKSFDTGKRHVHAECHGNIDARTLPRIAGSTLVGSHVDRVNYTTDAKWDNVAEFVRTEFKKLGWREVVSYGGRMPHEPGMPDHLGFVQRGMYANVLITEKDGKSEVHYQVSLLKYEPLIFPEVTKDIEFMDHPFLHVFYVTKADSDKVLEFYRNGLPALGWSMSDSTDKGADGQMKVALEGPEREPLRLEVLAKDGLTFVLLAGGE